MPNDFPQAASPEPASPIEAQVPGTTPEQGSTQEEPQQDKPLTLDDFRKIAREEATRVAQSQVAKGENRINQRIQEQFAALQKTAGVLNLTDEQVKKAQQDIVTQAYAAPESPASDSQPAAEQEYPPIVAAAIGMMNKAGVLVEEGDPEFDKFVKPILAQGPKVDESLLLATSQAITAKQARIASQKENAVIRSPGGGGSTASGNAPAASASDYWKRAHK